MQGKEESKHSTTEDTEQVKSGVNRNTLFSSSLVPEPSLNMASSSDRTKHFEPANQVFWLKYSEEIINELAILLPHFPQQKPQVREDIRCPEEVFRTRIGCAYAFLASKRRQVGKDLKQGPLRHQFGLFNKAGFAATDDFNLNKDLPTQKDKIYELVFALLSQENHLIEIDKQPKDNDNGFIYTIKIKMSIEEKTNLHSKNVASEVPFIENENVLTITLHDYGKNNDRNTIVINHNPTPFSENYTSKSSYFQVQFEMMEPYFQACLNWDSSQGVNEFLVNAGKLAHSLARLQPVGRGNSAIVEWMIRGLAQAKRIDLGVFNASEKIGWDFKAFLTPDIQEYAKWFSEKAFVSCVYEGTSNRLQSLS